MTDSRFYAFKQIEKRFISGDRDRHLEEIHYAGRNWDVNIKLAQVPRQIKVSDKPRGKLTIECDELWSFVNSKGNEYYIWLAIDRKTKEIIGCFVGEVVATLLVPQAGRTRDSARELWRARRRRDPCGIATRSL